MKRNAGNVLWFILIAIFLLAALTMLITRTSMQTEETGDAERGSIKASEIMRYTSSIASAVDRMRMNGCSENAISFWSDDWDTPALYDNTNNPEGRTETKYECFVFDTRGGGIQHKLTPTSALRDGAGAAESEPYISGATSVNNVGSPDGDLVIFIPHIREEICRAVNSSLRIANMPVDGINGAAPATGGFSSTSGLGDNDPASIALSGKKSGCFESLNYGGFAAGEFIFYQVLIPR